MGFALFENFSVASDKHKDSALHPFIVKMSKERVGRIVLENLKKEGLEEYKYYEDFGELFYYDYDFEVTLSFVNDGSGGTRVGGQVYGENKRGRTRKKLKQVLAMIKGMF